MRDDIEIRPETPKDYKDIVSLVLRSFREGTNYSDGSDIIALIEEIRVSKYYIPELSFVAEMDGKHLIPIRVLVFVVYLNLLFVLLFHSKN